MTRTKKVPSLFQAFLPILIMIVLLGVGGAIFNLRLEILLLLTTLLSGLIAVYLGYGWDDIINAITEKVSKTFPALMILLMVGLLIGTWMIGGTIPYMVKIGLSIISPQYIIITAFVVSAFVSLCTGTSWGSVSTVGVALMSIAVGMDARLDMVAGAIVSGAYFGDKMSPLSDTTNLASIAAGSKLYEHIGHMIYTTGPAFIVAAIVYFFLGLNSDGHAESLGAGAMESIQQMDKIYNFNLWLLLPVLIVLYGSVRQKPTIPVMMISGIVATCNAIFIHGFDMNSAIDAAITGVKPEMFSSIGIKVSELSADLQTLLLRGGMVSMLETLLVALCAFAFAGVMAVSGSLEIVLKFLLRMVTNTGSLILTTIISCFLTIGITSNGQISILLPGELFKESYKKFGLKPVNLSRTLEDSATVIEPLVPWTVAGMFMAKTLGVPTLSYLPFAIVCYTGFIFALIWGYTGLFIKKIDSLEPETK
ncbi:Na+/H+ antiporter NhaC [Puteibacter caeruleilacunae]|nr:Na+/H+ antiporter NhaC [Puteibacter caeruleilacunae]